MTAAATIVIVILRNTSNCTIDGKFFQCRVCQRTNVWASAGRCDGPTLPRARRVSYVRVSAARDASASPPSAPPTFTIVL